MVTGEIDGVARLPRVALFGEFGIQNLGNEATLRSFVRMLDGAAELVTVCNDPDLVDADLTLPRVRFDPLPLIRRSGRPARIVNRLVRLPRAWGRALRVMGGFDLVVVAGTGILEDTHRQRAWRTPLTVLMAVLAARARRATVAFVAVGVTPSTSLAKRAMFRRALRAACYRSYRDRYSADAAAGLGVETAHDRVSGDVVMADPSSEPHRSPDDPGSRREVMIGVMEHPDGRAGAYPRSVATLVGDLRRRGYEPWLTLGEPGDRLMADTVNEIVRDNEPGAQTCRIVHCETLRELEEQMADVELAFVARYHHLVAALRLGIPTATIGYSAKFGALMDRYSLGSFDHAISSVTPEDLLADLDVMVGDTDGLRTTIASAHAAYLADLAAETAALRALATASVRPPRCR